MRTATLLRSILVPVAIATVAGLAQAASTTIVISEFRTRGAAGANDEIVELWNRSASVQSIAGWKLNGSNTAGTTSTRATVPAGVTLGPGCYYLLVNGAATASIVALADQTFAVGITDDGGIAILDPTNAIIDQAGMSATSAYKEGTVLAPLTTNVDQSYERKPGGTSGHVIDTDDNANDFQLITPATPQNRTATCLVATATHEPTWGRVKMLYR